MVDIGNDVSEIYRHLQKMLSKARGRLCRCPLKQISIQNQKLSPWLQLEGEGGGTLRIRQGNLEFFSEKNAFMPCNMGKGDGGENFHGQKVKTLTRLT